MTSIVRHHVLDTPIDAVDMEGALSFVAQSVKERTEPGFILAVNPEKVFALREDKELKMFFEKASLLIPDGIGMVKALKLLYKVRISRVPGADLMQNICAEATTHDYKIFIYGASEHVNSTSCDILRQKHPGIKIVGRANGFVKQEEMADLVAKINDSQADILFIAMGSPRQERWMQTYAKELKTVKICQGIGGTLDTIVGTVKRAPKFWQKMQLEWFYRLLCQPSRATRQIRCLKFGLEVYKTKFFGK